MIIWRLSLTTALPPPFVLFIFLCCAALIVSFGNWCQTWGLPAGSPQLGWAGPTSMCLEAFSLQTHLPRRKQTQEGSGFLVGVQRDAGPAVGGGFTTSQSSADDLPSFAFCGGVCWHRAIFHLKNGSSFAVCLPCWRFSMAGVLQQLWRAWGARCSHTTESEKGTWAWRAFWETLEPELGCFCACCERKQRAKRPNQTHAAEKGV